MTVEKAELKALWLGDEIKALEERRNALGDEALRLEGASAAFSEAAKKIETDIPARIKAQLDAGEIPIECAQYARDMVLMAVRYLRHLEAVSVAQAPVCEGRKAELDALIKRRGKQKAEEETKAIALRQSKTGNGAGQHPGESLKAERTKKTTKRAAKKTTKKRAPRKKTTKRATKKESTRAANA